MQSLSFRGYAPKSRTVQELISERNKEIELLESKILEMDYNADQDIYQYSECAGRLRPLHGRQKRQTNDTGDYTIARTSKLLEEQDTIQQKIRSIQRANQLSRASIAGINKMPNEVLGLIFREYVDPDQSVWSLVDVCPQWRDVIYTTPHLWSSITLTWDHGAGNEETRSCRGRSHVCYHHNHFKTILDRSGSVILDVIIEYKRISSQDVQEILKTLELLNSPSISNRVRSLDVRMGEAQIVMEAWTGCFFGASFTKLEHLKIGEGVSSRWNENLFRAISGTSTRLTTLKCYRDVYKIVLPDYIWRNIQVLQFRIAVLSGDMDRSIHKCLHVEELTCIGRPWPTSLSPAVTFSNLLTAAFSCLPTSFRLLQLPAIQNLRVYDLFRDPHVTTLDFMTTPNLRSIEIDSLHPDEWLTNVSMDRLEELRLTIPREPIGSIPNTLQGTSVHTFTALRTLFLASPTKDTFAIALLELLPSLNSVTCACSNYYDERYGLKLLPHLARYDGERFLCSPNLKELTLGQSPQYHVQTRRGPLVPLIKRLIDLRVMHDSPLLKLEILWRDRGEHQQYI
jgi:hypothetical protein